jgi:predicted ArsR family transcriptional regulator
MKSQLEPLRVRVLDALEEVGPATAHSVAKHVCAPVSGTRQCIHRLMDEQQVEEVGRLVRSRGTGNPYRLYAIKGAISL